MNLKPTKIIIVFVLLFSSIQFFPTALHAQENFGAWSISRELFDYIRQTLESGKTILEFGSGWASGELSKYYTVYSIEHDAEWINKYNTHYIYAPKKSGWYDVEEIKKGMPQKYDLILVDGPTYSRDGFYTNLDLFDTTIPIIFDDIDREKDYKLMVKVAEKLNRNFTIIGTLEANRTSKPFGIIL